MLTGDPQGAASFSQGSRSFSCELVDQGTLSLDDPISTYVPGMPNGDTATHPGQHDQRDSSLQLQRGVPGRVLRGSFDRVRTSQLVDYVKDAEPSFPADSPALPSPHSDGITVQADSEGQVKDVTDFNPSGGFTSGAMISSLDDLRAWAVALGTGEGWISPELQAERMASMASTVSGNTSIQHDPATKRTIVVMVNSDIPSGNANPALSISAELRDALAVS